MFAGTYVRTLDDKHRIAIPRSLRDSLDATSSKVLYLGPGTESTINVFTEQTLEEMGKKLGNAALGPDQRVFSRLFFAQVQPMEMDSQGRIRIPTELQTWAKVESEVVLIGVRDHIEIWSHTVWKSYMEKWQSQFDQVADRAFVQENPSTENSAK